MRSTLRAADEGLELVGADLDLAGDERAGVGARLGAPAPAHDGLDARDELLGVAGLGEPVVGAQPQAAHALGDRRAGPVQTTTPRPGSARAEPLEVVPALRAEQREVDDDAR